MTQITKQKILLNRLQELRHLTDGWISIILIIVIVWTMVSYNLFNSINNLLYDTLIQQSTPHLDKDMLIVAIDDKSLQKIGTWPWPRDKHALLLNKLNKARPRSIYIDLLFTQRDSFNSENDVLMAEEISHAPVFLPIELFFHENKSLPTVSESIPLFTKAAKGLGYVNLAPDLDGTLRSVFLKLDTSAGSMNHVGVKIVNHLKAETNQKYTHSNFYTYLHELTWFPNNKTNIPYTGQASHIAQISYIDVIEGNIPDELLENRIVFVGATAQSLTSRLHINERNNIEGLANIEIVANVVDSLLHNKNIALLSKFQYFLVFIFPFLGLLYLLKNTKKNNLQPLYIISASLIIFILSILLLTEAGVWVPPFASLFSFFLLYVFWSWKRVEISHRYFVNQLRQIQSVNSQINTTEKRSYLFKNIHVDTHADELENAIRKINGVNNFITQSLVNLPVAICICSTDGIVTHANTKASRIFSVFSKTYDFRMSAFDVNFLLGQSMSNLLDNFQITNENHPPSKTTNTFTSICEDKLGRRFRMEHTPIAEFDDGSQSHWLYTFIDLTDQKKIDQYRSDLLNFLSHDLAKPQSAILAMIELQSMTKSAVNPNVFTQQLRDKVNTTLKLTKGFIELTRTEFSSSHLNQCDLSDLVLDAIDLVWPMAHIKRIELEKIFIDNTLPVYLDCLLVTRAITNLLENAIKFSPANSIIKIILSISENNDFGVLMIEDIGGGISDDDLPKLFKPFSQIINTKHSVENQGHGLGLAQAYAAITRSGGKLEYSRLELGSRFTISLPLYQRGDL